ncbi:uncharacterized protein DSM5745_08717 [Aspergillus mulundensis]|uniref:AMP-dependent synthetase/ligase domain-containing protein n=1 Tax=Aspergillus mulundensis TaxID=1810919 RepID=A0A3D8R4Q1_9EURO|nr:hypothetical protein DSM5745_08717 [Aspergillus mulundensis]RDW68957.1 hypothetical protein DSM5745_08717 [Aspergillus mulundensis]
MSENHGDTAPLLGSQRTPEYGAVEDAPVADPRTSSKFKRNLGTAEAFSIIISIVIGSGIFTSPGSIDTNVPAPGFALIVWAVGGLLAWTGAATMAELGTAIAGEGGVQPYLQYIFGDVFGFLAAWTWIVAVIPASLGIMSIVFVESVFSAIGENNRTQGALHKFLSIFVLIVFSMANGVSTKVTNRLNRFFVTAKFTAIAATVVAGIAVVVYHLAAHTDKSTQDWWTKSWFGYRTSVGPDGSKTDWSKVNGWEMLGHYSAALYGALWAYSGWDKAIYISAELSAPARQLPLAFNTAIPVIVGGYIAVNAAYYILLPWDVVSTSDSVAVTAFNHLLGPGVGLVAAAVICIVVAGALLGSAFVGSRMIVSASNKNWLPRFLGVVGHIGLRSATESADSSTDESESESDAPINALIFSTACSALYIIFGNFRALITFNGLGEYSFFFLTMVGALVLRIREPKLHRPYKPFFVIPVIFTLVSGFVVARGAVFAPFQAAISPYRQEQGQLFTKLEAHTNSDEMTKTTIEVPQHPWLDQLFHHWQESPERVFIRDLATDKEATFGEFLYEVLAHRDRLHKQLSPETQERLQDPSEEVFVAIIANAGFEFAVLLLAIHALGGIAVPLRIQVHAEEARYFLGTCNASLITSSQREAEHAQAISSELSIPQVTFAQNNLSPSKLATLHFEQVESPSSNGIPRFDEDRGFALLFTSGTTGSPKGVLSSSGSILKGTQYYQSNLSLTPRDTWLHHAPAHWKGGFDFLLAATYAGARIEFASSVFSPAWLLERIGATKPMRRARGPITCILALPSLLISVAEALEQIKRDEGQKEYEDAVQGVRDIRVFVSGSIRVPEWLKDVWRQEIIPGREVVNAYGFTEAAGMVAMTAWDAKGAVPKDCCGPHNPDLSVKVTDSGEICVKGPLVMKRFVAANLKQIQIRAHAPKRRYISDNPDVMDNVFDADGYYKTGDMGTVSANGIVTVLGRANQDMIRTMGYRVNSADVEDPLRSYPGPPRIAQAYVLGIEDAVNGQRVAALLLTQTQDAADSDAQSERNSNSNSNSKSKSTIDLASLRHWLATEKKIPAYKLPAAVRVIRKEEFSGLTVSGKPSKKKIAGLYFGEEAMERGHVDMWDFAVQEDFGGHRAWDWEGRPKRDV